MSTYPGKGMVAVLKTTSETVLEDIERVMQLGGMESALPQGMRTGLKINISWHFFYPGSSTTPWQLDGVIRALKKDGYDPARIHGCHNRTVVIDAHLGERRYMTGDALTVADIAVGAATHRWLGLPQPKLPRPNVERWYRQLMTRPATAGVLTLPIT